MEVSAKIYGAYAREILDSRGEPTIETTVILESGYRGTAGVPAGTSLGKYEALELRDHDPKRFQGMGVLKAVDNVNKIISPKIRGVDALNQAALDQAMIDLDGTQSKERLGSNAILSVSVAAAIASANLARIPLYQYFNNLINKFVPIKLTRMPTPELNVINGGKHGSGNLDFQEFLVLPASNTGFHEALRMGDEVYMELRQLLKHRNAITSVGFEGGYAPNLFTNIDAIEIIIDAVRQTPYRLGVNIFLGLDIASSHFKADGGYQVKEKQTAMNTGDFINYLKELHDKYRLLVLEDPLDEDDWQGWKQITEFMGKDVLIVGDDLLATNPARLTRAINERACSAVLLKPNQIGTLTEFFQVVTLAKKNNLACIVSHRSGETNDSYVADLGVAIQADYVKFGAPARGERVAKYNRLLAIEAELFKK